MGLGFVAAHPAPEQGDAREFTHFLHPRRRLWPGESTLYRATLGFSLQAVLLSGTQKCAKVVTTLWLRIAIFCFRAAEPACRHLFSKHDRVISSSCVQTPYLHFVAELTRAFPTRPIILLEARHVSVCLSWRAFSTDVMADAAMHILKRCLFRACEQNGTVATGAYVALYFLSKICIDCALILHVAFTWASSPCVLQNFRPLSQSVKKVSWALLRYLKPSPNTYVCLHAGMVSARRRLLGTATAPLCSAASFNGTGIPCSPWCAQLPPECPQHPEMSRQRKASEVGDRRPATHLKCPCQSPSDIDEWGLPGTGSNGTPCVLQVLMDPVCMLTIYPQLLQNFVYKKPRMVANVLGLVDSLRFVFSRDLLVAEVRPSIHCVCCT